MIHIGKGMLCGAGDETPTATCIYKRRLLHGHEVGALAYEDKGVTRTCYGVVVKLLAFLSRNT